MLGHRTLSVEDYTAILRRRWLILLIPTIILPIVMYAITFTIDPQYVSETLVLIDRQQVSTDFVRSVVNQDLDSRLASMQQQIESRSSLQPIIEKYGLYAKGGMSMDDRVDAVRKSITIKASHSDIGGGNGMPGFIISFKASDPHTAQSVCGEITGLFVQQSLITREAAVDQTTDFLKSQLADAKRSLDEQDSKLTAFQIRYFGKLPTDQTSNANVLASLNSQLNATTQQLQTLDQNKTIVQNMIAEAQQGVPATVAASRMADAHEKELLSLQAQQADLLTHYTAENPDVQAIQRKIQDLQRQIRQEQSVPATPVAPVAPTINSANLAELHARAKAIDIAIQNNTRQQAELEAQVHSYQSRLEGVPEVEEEYKQLTRDYGQAEDQYQTLLRQIGQAKTATDLEKRQQGEQFRIMDAPSLPDTPSYPKKPLFVIGGLIGGLGIGCLISALLEYKNTALRNERDIWAFTQLPTLAVIAYSGEVAHVKVGVLKRIKQKLFTRKHKQLVESKA